MLNSHNNSVSRPQNIFNTKLYFLTDSQQQLLAQHLQLFSLQQASLLQSQLHLHSFILFSLFLITFN